MGAPKNTALPQNLPALPPPIVKDRSLTWFPMVTISAAERRLPWKPAKFWRDKRPRPVLVCCFACFAAHDVKGRQVADGNGASCPWQQHDFDVKAWWPNLIAPYSTDNRSTLLFDQSAFSNFALYFIKWTNRRKLCTPISLNFTLVSLTDAPVSGRLSMINGNTIQLKSLQSAFHLGLRSEFSLTAEYWRVTTLLAARVFLAGNGIKIALINCFFF